MTAERFAEVDAHFRRLHEPSFGRVSAAADPHVRPGGGAVAFTGSVLTELVGRAPTRVCLAEGGDVRVLTTGAGRQKLPRFSPDGRLLAHLSDADTAGDFQLRVLDAHTLEPTHQVTVDGCVESLAWSPDGRSVLLQVAPHGVDLPGAQGSGSNAAAAGQPRASWEPEVLHGGARAPGRRSAWVFSLVSGRARRVSAERTNVWEAAWAGPDALVCVTSAGAGEDAWYRADVRLVGVSDGAETVLHTGDRQVGLVAGSPSGRTVAFVEARCSDRQVIAGDLLLVPTGPGGPGTPVRVDTHRADVSDLGWTGDDEIGYAALRGLRTVVGRCRAADTATPHAVDVWTSSETVGDYYPQASFSAAGDGAVLHGYHRYPEVVVIEEGTARTVGRLTHPGADYLTGLAGTIREVSWKAPDGLTVEGLLCTPDGPGPHPLVVNVHGGPVWAWRNTWTGAPSIPLLVGHGFAVLRPNPRGSGGRGQAFADAVLGDMGGADTQDILSGVDAMVEQGVADPRRLGVFGGSYGGFMAAWLVTQDQRFAASVPVAPVTDWYTQHLTSNIPHFDRIFLDADPASLTGPYVARSPVRHAAAARTPTLLVAGAHDRCAPPGQALEFHQALVAAGVESVLVTYPEEGHGVGSFPAVTDYCARVLEWFDRHMGPSGPGRER